MGEHPGRARDTGTRVFGAFGKRWLRVAARYMPLPPATRAWLHPRRGVNVGRRVFIGTEVFIDDSVPSSVTLEDDVTVIAQTTILGHAYYPRHFHRLLGAEATRAELRTTICQRRPAALLVAAPQPVAARAASGRGRLRTLTGKNERDNTATRLEREAHPSRRLRSVEHSGPPQRAGVSTTTSLAGGPDAISRLAGV